jgi:hypothetical protein
MPVHGPIGPDWPLEDAADQALGNKRKWKKQGMLTKGAEERIAMAESVRFEEGHGDDEISLPPLPSNQIDRFRKFIPDIEQVGTDGCWVWQGAYNSRGVPTFWDSGVQKPLSAARWAYDFLVEPVDPAFRVERTCGNHLCVAPFHGRVVRIRNE